jgi:hypothetical protein
MSHRIQNNVGYKKIYPMSNYEDDGFCHYCGRKPSIILSLEWDHVPALNVRIPPDCNDIRKTLIRACKECNILAGDFPHMDYLERHFWLKGAYLRAYKKLLLNEGTEDIDRSHMNGHLLAALNNSDLKHEEILSAIGFGIREIDEIDSPILSLRTKKTHRILQHIIIEYFHGIPNDDDDDDFLLGSIEHKDDESVPPYIVKEFVCFLADEVAAGNIINNSVDYRNWLKDHPERALSLELPVIPDKHLGVSWDRINILLEDELSVLEKNELPSVIIEIINSAELHLSVYRLENEIEFSKDSLIEILKYADITSQEEYNSFLQLIKNEDIYIHFPHEPIKQFEYWELWS